MGCASSNPLVEGGKNLMDNAKQATDNVIDKGEKVMHDAGDAVSTGIDNMKSAVESGIQNAQQNIGAVVNNIENTMGIAKNKAEEGVAAVDSVVEDVTNKTTEAVEETISDAKTVLAFEDATSNIEDEIKEIENMEKEAAKKLEAIKDEFGETVEAVETKLEETLHIEDVEHMNDATGAAASTQDAKEEPQPTPWEAAADAILEQRMSLPPTRVATLDIDDGSGFSDNAYVNDELDVVYASNTPATNNNYNYNYIDNDSPDEANDDNCEIVNRQHQIEIEDEYDSNITDVESNADTTMTRMSPLTSNHSTGTTSTLSTSNSSVGATTAAADTKDYNGTSTDLLLSDTISIKSYKSEI